MQGLGPRSSTGEMPRIQGQAFSRPPSREPPQPRAEAPGTNCVALETQNLLRFLHGTHARMYTKTLCSLFKLYIKLSHRTLIVTPFGLFEEPSSKYLGLCNRYEGVGISVKT